MSFDNILGRPTEPEPTIWRQAHDLIVEAGWGTGTAEHSVTGCHCAGGAIAKVLTGDADDMYDDHKLPNVELPLLKFADHVNAPRADEGGDGWVFDFPSERVAQWNDSLPKDKGKEIVLKALLELDELERAK